MAKLNLGSGFSKKEGWINLDNNPQTRPEILRDLNHGIPYNNNTITEILAEHILEHFEGHELIRLFNEMHRVLIPFGKLEFAVPWGNNSFIDPTHKQHFIPLSFNFFFLPDNNSIGSGVKGWFRPIKLIMKDSEFRWFFEKIPDSYLIEHMEKYYQGGTTYDFKYQIEDLRTK